MNTKLTPKQYIDFNFKIMQDAINDIINGKKTDMVNLSFDDEINFASDNNEIHIAENDVNNKISATDILTDTSHRYISDVDLEKLNQSINKTELNATVKEITNNFKLALNDQIDNILNSKDTIHAINNIKEAINNNEETINLFRNLVSKEELKEHSNDGLHLNAEDRIALNLLLKFIDKGCADWNAEEGEANYIRNKPTSLPANGGNATTLGGYCAYKLMTKQLDKYIIGINTAKSYGLSEVNILLTDKNVKNMSKYITPNTRIGIREGLYEPGELYINSSMIHGTSKFTIISNADIYIEYNSTIKDLYFDNCKFNIPRNSSNIIINNVKFNNCQFKFDNSWNIIIKDCTFSNCVFNIDMLCDSIIKDNILENTPLKYYGGNNIIKDNIEL